MTAIRQTKTGTANAGSNGPISQESFLGSNDRDAVASADDEPGRQPLLTIDLLIDDDAIDAQQGLDEDTIAHDVMSAASALSCVLDVMEEPSEAAVRVAPDEAVRALNAAYRGKDKPTNVLSFPAPDGAPGDTEDALFLGDIIIASGVLAAEAADRDIPLSHHLQHLVIHGLLHLLGYDHETGPDDAEEMEAIEIAALARLSVPNPYEGELCDD